MDNIPIEEMPREIDRLLEENERLNNIIDELEEENKELKEEVKRVKFILSGHWEEYEKEKE